MKTFKGRLKLKMESKAAVSVEPIIRKRLNSIMRDPSDEETSDLENAGNMENLRNKKLALAQQNRNTVQDIKSEL